ncbi:MAG: ribulokinase [Phycisphaeraceae bacterium]|nr:ribulokinase [Phycisphaeraceae bacterium]
MAQTSRVALGLDFGTESVRALLVDLDGHERGSAVQRYRHGQITSHLPGHDDPLPEDFALQDPTDWLNASAKAVRTALAESGIDGQQVIGIGVDFTSCTMLPCLRDGTPLCQLERWTKEKYAWPKLWKHHGARDQTDHINDLARKRKEKWLDRYGGTIGLEWFFPKILETLEQAPAVYDAAEVWIEAGDWYVWQLIGPERTDGRPPRSTCQAGYKAMWNSRDGYPSSEFFRALHPKMADVVAKKMPGVLLAPGQCAGELGPLLAKKMGLVPGIAVSAAIIDAHAGVPGAGVSEAGTLVMVMGTSSCHMLNAKSEKLFPGVAGVVENGILPGFFGYETGQAAVGDAFEWLRQLCGREFADLDRKAAKIEPGAAGVLCMDWLNGCRTPLMDGGLRGAFTGLTLAHGPEHLYRALLEASAFGLRWIVEVLRQDLPVKRFVATGGLPHHNPLLVQIYADVLGEPILVHSSRQGPALGAAILGVLAAGPEVSGFTSATAAITALARPPVTQRSRDALTVKPSPKNTKIYDSLYKRYRTLADDLSKRRRVIGP